MRRGGLCVVLQLYLRYALGERQRSGPKEAAEKGQSPCKMDEKGAAAAKQAAEKLDFSKSAKNGSRQDAPGTIRRPKAKVFYHQFRGHFDPLPSFSAACKARIDSTGFIGTTEVVA